MNLTIIEKLRHAESDQYPVYPIVAEYGGSNSEKPPPFPSTVTTVIINLRLSWFKGSSIATDTQSLGSFIGFGKCWVVSGVLAVLQ